MSTIIIVVATFVKHMLRKIHYIAMWETFIIWSINFWPPLEWTLYNLQIWKLQSLHTCNLNEIISTLIEGPHHPNIHTQQINKMFSSCPTWEFQLQYNHCIFSNFVKPQKVFCDTLTRKKERKKDVATNMRLLCHFIFEFM